MGLRDLLVLVLVWCAASVADMRGAAGLVQADLVRVWVIDAVLAAQQKLDF